MLQPSSQDSTRLSDAKRELLARRLSGQTSSLRHRSISKNALPHGAEPTLSPGQEQLLFQAMLDPKSPAHNLVSCYQTTDALPDLDSIQRRLDDIVSHHAIFRSRYRMTPGGPACSVQNFDESRVPVRKIYCPHPSEAASEEAAVPFDLSVGPLLRLTLIESTDCTRSPRLAMLVAHHMIADETTIDWLWKELASSDPVANPEQQYTDFAAWHSETCASGSYASQADFWKTELANASNSSRLPFRPQIGDTGGFLRRCTTSPALQNRLLETARETGTSLFVLGLTALAIVLHRYTGNGQWIIGVPVSHRPLPETEKMPGYFLNVLPVHVSLTRVTSIYEAITSVHQACSRAFANRDLPLQKIVHAAGCVGGTAPFRVMAVQRQRPRAFSWESAKMEPIEIEVNAAKFDLTFFISEGQAGLDLLLECACQALAYEQAEAMLGHLTKVLETFTIDRSAGINTIDIATSLESERLQRLSRGLPLPTSGRESLMARIASSLHSNPTRPAVIFRDQGITNAELSERASALANELRQLGVRPGEPIILHAEPSIDAIVGILGILAAGAAYVPIDPTWPEARAEKIISTLGVRTIVTSPLTKPGHPAEVKLLPIPQAGRGRSPVVLDVEPADDDLAYILFTSGSTGEPKGVSIYHGNLTFSTLARIAEYRSPPESFLLYPSLAFDSSVAGIFWCLATAGTLVIPTSDERRDPRLLGALLGRHQVRTLLCIPSVYRQILAADEGNLSSLHTAIVAGEVCAPGLVAEHFRKLDGCRLFNEYGPTEATVWATVHRCEPVDANFPLPIGRPIPGAEVYVLDDARRLLPQGIEGEIWIGGPGVAQGGYWRQEELTATAFIANPFASGKLYKTGDRGRWNTAGSLQFCGRTDHQIKVRGVRIEAAEIESAILSHPFVSDAAVVSFADPDAGWLAEVLALLQPDEARSLLDEARCDPNNATHPCIDSRVATDENFHISLSIKPEAVQTPRQSQREWLLRQAMDEFRDDLAHLDTIAGKFVSGRPAGIDDGYVDVMSLDLTDAQIMEDWQVPLMRAMAAFVAESSGDVLEIGFGRGVAAELIQQHGVRSHTIVEPHPVSIERHFKPWQARHSGNAIRLIEGRWEDVTNCLGIYDAVLFHAYPLNEEDFIRHIVDSIVYAEHAMPEMASRLRPGGVFTYLSTEVDSLSRRHQRLLFRHFSSITTSILPLAVPPYTADTWWAPSMVTVKAVK